MKPYYKKEILSQEFIPAPSFLATPFHVVQSGIVSL